MRAIAGIAADAGTCLTPLQGTSRNGSADVMPARPSPDEFDRETGEPKPDRVRPRPSKPTPKAEGVAKP